jgi:hypothetical protein
LASRCVRRTSGAERWRGCEIASPGGRCPPECICSCATSGLHLGAEHSMTIRITIDLATASPMQRALFTDPQLQHTLTALRDFVGDATADVEVRGGAQFRPHRTGVHVVQRMQDFKSPIDSAAYSQEPAILNSPPRDDVTPSQADLRLARAASRSAVSRLAPSNPYGGTGYYRRPLTAEMLGLVALFPS